MVFLSEYGPTLVVSHVTKKDTSCRGNLACLPSKLTYILIRWKLSFGVLPLANMANHSMQLITIVLKRWIPPCAHYWMLANKYQWTGKNCRSTEKFSFFERENTKTNIHTHSNIPTCTYIHKYLNTTYISHRHVNMLTRTHRVIPQYTQMRILSYVLVIKATKLLKHWCFTMEVSCDMYSVASAKLFLINVVIKIQLKSDLLVETNEWFCISNLDTNFVGKRTIN